MKVSVTGAQMKRIDADTIERIGIPSMVLMERAALAVADAVERIAGEAGFSCGGSSGPVQAGEGRQERDSLRGRPARIWIACGTGNNGADGIAAGRILHGRGYEVTVLLAGDLEHASLEHRSQQAIAARLGVTLVEYHDFIPGSCDIIVDAVFGIGLRRKVEGEYRELLEMLAAQKTKRVVAVDIPSGIHADNGCVMGMALPARITVTFGYQKTGMLLYPGREYAGEVVVADIGFSDISLENAGWDAFVTEPADLSRLPVRRRDSNKGTYGKLLLIAGSRGMSGAAYLSALSAYRTGAGLVKILTVEDNRQILQSQLPEAIVETYRPEDVLQEEEEFARFIEEQCGWATAIVMGPGLSGKPYVERLVELVLTHAYVPIVLDADALNAVAAHPALTAYYTENIIITPHVGEMGRLTGRTVPEIKKEALAVAREYSGSHGITCVLKDAVTVTADRDGITYLHVGGNSGMAKGGSGDVLAGVIGSLLAQGAELSEAAVLGACLHGLAGDAAAKALGERSILAHEIGDFISEALAGL